VCVFLPGPHPRGIKGFMTPKLPKLDLTTDSEYIAILVKVICGCKRVTVQFITCVCYTDLTTFLLTDIIGYDRLKFS